MVDLRQPSTLDVQQQQKAESGFRPDIQALRAIAVGSVVLFHLWPNAVPGGYVGVDVFFVISGFLITQHLYREIEATGRLSFTQFYARRIRRLLPAAFVVLAVSLAAVVLVMPRVVWRNNLMEIGASASYVENWLLAHMAVDYLAADDTPSLVQHYWSLSVEEQFYALWPVILVLAVWLSRRVGLRARAGAIVALGGIGVVSFAASIYLTAHSQAMAFFVTPTRVWEFALGGLVGLVVRRWSGGLAVAAAWCGVGVVLASCFLITSSAAFPGWIAAVPTVAAATVLAGGSGATGSGSLRRIADVRVVQWTGAYSYSIYLWHWPPIIVAPWVLHGPLGNVAKVGILVATLVLAWATKRWIEDPIRTGGWWTARRWPAYGMAAAGGAALLALSGAFFLQLSHGNDARRSEALAHVADGTACYGSAAMVEQCSRPYARPADDVIAFAADDIPHDADGCQQPALAAPGPTWCTFGDGAGRGTIAVVGNSYAVQYLPMLEQWAANKGLEIRLAARTDCLGLSTRPVSSQPEERGCAAWSAAVQRDLLASKDLAGVIFVAHEAAQDYLAGTGAGASAVERATANVLATLDAYKRAGVPTMVLGHAPGTRPVSAPECVALSRADYDPCVRSRSQFADTDLLTEIVQAHPDATAYLPVDEFFCDTDRCHAAIGGMVAYYDDHHISATYARTMAAQLAPGLDELARATTR